MKYSPSLYYVLLNDYGESEIYEEAMQVETRKKRKQTMEEEMNSSMQNQTWDLVKFFVGKATLQKKWVYKLKEEDGGKKRYKVGSMVNVGLNSVHKLAAYKF